MEPKYLKESDTVTVTIINVSGASVDLPSGTLKAVVTRGA